MFQNQKGFTLVELLVAIGIIGILATVTTVSVTSIRAKGRDTKRVTDIKALQANLEIYAEVSNGYPRTPTALTVIQGSRLCTDSATPANAGFRIAAGDSCADLIFKVPTNPGPGGSDYKYKGEATGQTYEIQFTLESASATIKKGCNKATEKGIENVSAAKCS